VSDSGEGPSTSYAYRHEAPDGTIWMSDDQGLRRVSAEPGAPAYSPPPGARKRKPAQFGDFTFDRDGSLWAVTANGVRRFDDVAQWPSPIAVETAPGESFTPADGLSSDAAWKILIDREGTVWVATNSGLDRLRRNIFTTTTLPRVQEREFAIAAGEDGSIWTASSALALTHVAANGAITSFPGTGETLCVRRDHNGTIWSAGAGKIHLWHSSGTGFVPLHYPGEDLDSVVAVATDRHNDPWITARSGRVYHLTGGRWSNQNKALGKKPGVIGAMTDDAEGNVWFAFSDRVVEWDGSGYHSFVRDSHKVRGVSETTMSVRGDRVWMGGAGGIQLFTHGHFYTMRWKDADLPGRVSGVLETAAGDLWANGFSGVTHVAAGELKKWLRDPGSAVSGEHFDELDGLPGLSGEKLPEPSVVEGADGRLWFATIRGIAWLDPAALEKNRNRLPPPVLISSVAANGRTYAARNGMTLPPHSENLEIDYTALSLAAPERMQFRYRLEGVDHDWQNPGARRQAYYTKLRPGAYWFRVMASNNDGVWNEAGAMLNLKIAPAWFQTAWFFALCAASGILAMWLLYRLRMRQVAAGINARFEERLAERTRIAQELHDTLLQGFLSASMQVHIAADRLPGDSPALPILTRALAVMSQVIEDGRNAVRELRSSRSGSLDLEAAIASVQQELEPETGGGAQTEFCVITEGRRRPLRPLLRDEVYRIVREALINAFRHARASRVEVRLEYTLSQFQVSVSDNGCGIEPELLRAGRPGHWGLCGMRERAERIGVRLRIFSSASAGTEVALVVPARVAFQDGGGARFRWLHRRDRRRGTETPATGSGFEAS